MSEKKRLEGIQGISGNPSHFGHVAVSMAAKLQGKLDGVTWMINPRSPFKDPNANISSEDKLRLANIVVRNSGRLGQEIIVSDFEVVLRHLGAHNASNTMLEHYVESYPSIQPVWIMGSDNMAGFHKWGSWENMIETYPILIVTRAGGHETIEQSVAGKQYISKRLDIDLFTGVPGTWAVVDMEPHPASSTEIRESLLKGETPKYIPEEAIDYIFKRKLFGCGTQ